MSRFHQPRRGWLPQLLDGLKLALLGVFLVGYLALTMPSYEFQLPNDGMESPKNEVITEFQEDSIKG